MLKQLEVGEGVVDRKPSITITLSSDGEADDDEEAVVVGENSNQWLKKQEAEVGEVEQEVEELLEVAKEDITARLELQVDDNKVEEEGNMNEDTNNKTEEGEGVEQGDSDGAKASLASLGKLATTLSSNENSEDPVEAQPTENNEKTADIIEEKTEKEYEEKEGTVEASSKDKAQVVAQDLDISGTSLFPAATQSYLLQPNLICCNPILNLQFANACTSVQMLMPSWLRAIKD